jgi:hypothetical protein
MNRIRKREMKRKPEEKDTKKEEIKFKEEGREVSVGARKRKIEGERGMKLEKKEQELGCERVRRGREGPEIKRGRGKINCPLRRRVVCIDCKWKTLHHDISHILLNSLPSWERKEMSSNIMFHIFDAA